MWKDEGNNEPFAFWLVRNFLPHDDDPEELEPISNREFYAGIVLGAIATLAFGFFVR